VLKYIKLPVFVAVIAGIMGVQSLHADWTDNGIPLGTAGGGQESPVITYDGTGGAVIAWIDTRSPVNADIYAQGVTADGAIRWFPIAMPVCTAGGYQSNPMIIPDGAGGTIIAWQDPRSGGTVDIYVQKLNVIGYIAWAANGVAITANPFYVNRPGYFVNAQTLGGSVTGAAGDEVPEQHLIYTYAGIEAELVSRSSRNGGAPILREAEILELAQVLEVLDHHFEPRWADRIGRIPEGSEAHVAAEVEFLIAGDDRDVVVLQARPFVVVYSEGQR